MDELVCSLNTTSVSRRTYSELGFPDVGPFRFSEGFIGRQTTHKGWQLSKYSRDLPLNADTHVKGRTERSPSRGGSVVAVFQVDVRGASGPFDTTEVHATVFHESS